MKKGVVILIIVGTLCYFGMRWYSRKHPEGSRVGRLISLGQWVSPKGEPGLPATGGGQSETSEVVYEKDIILETSKEKEDVAQTNKPAPEQSERFVHTAQTTLQPTKKGIEDTPAVAISGTESEGKNPATPSLEQETQPAPATAKPNTIELAMQYLKEEKKYEARNLLSDAYLTEASESNRKEIKERLDKLNEELVFSPNPSKDAAVYVVRPGDTLIKIAKQYNTSYELIMRLNKKQNTNIRVNEQLKVLNGTVSLLADKSDFTLTVLLDGHYIKQYPVGTGVSGKTPVGAFKIKDKLKNPVWYSPEGVYEYGNPKNILGTRWAGFEDKPGLHGYGIHGTTLPDTIGKESSMGCIRMI
ncbi:MAG: L,D-transpeptidase family protein, partial [Planctomycetes bacterium]|nr:L,D-transpeptidase family protein [Planctomycetota bacterium]